MTIETSESQVQPEQPRKVFDWMQFFPYILLVVVLAIVSITVPNFFSVSNFVSVLLQTSSLVLMALGMTAVLITGGIDLSVPGMMALGAILGAMFMRAGGNPIIGVLIMVAVSTALGAFNGFAVSYLRMIPFVVTLATQAVLGGAAVWITQQITISGLPPVFKNTVLGNPAFPTPIIFAAIMVIIAQLVLTRTVFGRWLYSVGTNIRAARVSGVPAQRVVFLAYVISGFMAGLAGIVLTARLASAGAPMGKDAVVMDAIAAAAVGGVSIFGGVGTALEAVVGAIIITLISNVMNMANVSYFLTLVIKGVIIVAVVAIDALRRRGGK